MRIGHLRMLWLSVWVLCPAGAAHAALIQYTDRTAWEAAIETVTGTEDFNGFAVDTEFRTTAVTLNNMTVTGTTGVNGSRTQKIDVPPEEFAGLYIVDGTPYLLGDLLGDTEFVRVDFKIPVIAWGGDMSGIANSTPVPPRFTRIDVFDTWGGLLGTVTMSSATNASLSFYGFDLTAGYAGHLVFVNSSESNDVFGVDNIAFKRGPIPEPATLSLLGLGLLALRQARGRRSRRRRRR